MKKTSLLLALLICAMCAFSVIAEEDNEQQSSDSDLLGITSVGIVRNGSNNDDSQTNEGDKSASDNSESLKNKAKDELDTKDKDKNTDDDDDDKDDDEEENSGLATLPNGTAYVGVYSYLNLRDGVWGNITGSLYNNEEVTITGRDGDWYKVSTSKGDGYAHARYIFATKDARYSGNEVTSSSSPSGNDSGSSSDVVIDVDGDSLQGKIVSAAKQIHDKYQGYQAFPYDPLTEGGNLGCAQVATTVLKAAGAIDSTCLNCNGTISLLEAKGWSAVNVPPYQAGDVIFWTTYQPGASHVGIVMNSGNTAQAMNNSSSKRMPQYSDVNYATIYKVYRKC